MNECCHKQLLCYLSQTLVEYVVCGQVSPCLSTDLPNQQYIIWWHTPRSIIFYLLPTNVCLQFQVVNLNNVREVIDDLILRTCENSVVHIVEAYTEDIEYDM